MCTSNRSWEISDLTYRFKTVKGFDPFQPLIYMKFYYLPSAKVSGPMHFELLLNVIPGPLNIVACTSKVQTIKRINIKKYLVRFFGIIWFHVWTPSLCCRFFVFDLFVQSYVCRKSVALFIDLTAAWMLSAKSCDYVSQAPSFPFVPEMNHSYSIFILRNPVGFSHRNRLEDN